MAGRKALASGDFKPNGPVTPMYYARPCAANGCPLGGTFNPTIIGEAREWWCWIHFQYGPTELQEVTRIIRASGDLLQSVFRQSQSFYDMKEKRSRGDIIKAYSAARTALDNLVAQRLGKPHALANLHAEAEREPGEEG